MAADRGTSRVPTLEDALRLAARLLSEHALDELRTGQGQSARLVLGGVAFNLAAGPTADATPSNVLFDNPLRDRSVDEILASLSPKVRRVYHIVATMRSTSQSRDARVRRRDVFRALCESTREAESIWTTTHALQRLVAEGLLVNARRLGYTLARPAESADRAFSDKARNPTPANQ